MNPTLLRYKQHLVYLWKLTLKMCTHPIFATCATIIIIQRVFKANKENRSYKHTVGIFEWSPHNENCSVCVQFNKIKKGGRPKKLKVGRPLAVSIESAVHYIKKIEPESFFNDSEHPEVFPPPQMAVQLDHLKCPLCSKIVSRPVYLTQCENLVCGKCCSQALEKSGKLVCPCCESEHIQDFSHITKPPQLVLSVLGSLQFACGKCGLNIPSGM